LKDILAKPFPTITEFIFMMFVVATFTIFVTFIDIMIHDSYVRPIIAECYETNDSKFCEERRSELLRDENFWVETSNQNPQIQLGGNYWLALLTIPIFVAGLLAVTRPVLGVMAGAKINPMLFIIGGLWGFSVFSLYYFGWLDFLYFYLRDMPIPETLDWLNGVGLFALVQPYGPTDNVDNTDLYLLMGIGVVLLVGIWSFFIHHHRKKTWHTLGLI